jgi:putative transposase
VVSPRRRRQQVPAVHRRGLPYRRACQLLSVARSSLGYQPRRGARDAELLAVVQQLAQQRPRYGYRRIWALLQRQGVHVNPKRIYRLWREHGLGLPARPRRQRTRALILRLPEATRPHEMWAYDFVHDRCANGAALKCLAVVDEYTRLCLAIEVGSRINSRQVLNVLTCLVHKYGVPSYIRSDNGPEFIAKAIKDWLAAQGIATAYIDPGKPWQNGAVESFIGKFRDECLNTEWFLNRTEARILIENYRSGYNEERPHSSLGYRTPAEVYAEAMTRPAAKIHEEAGEPLASTGLTLPMVQ